MAEKLIKNFYSAALIKACKIHGCLGRIMDLGGGIVSTINNCMFKGEYPHVLLSCSFFSSLAEKTYIELIAKQLFEDYKQFLKEKQYITETQMTEMCYDDVKLVFIKWLRQYRLKSFFNLMYHIPFPSNIESLQNFLKENSYKINNNDKKR